MADVGKIIFKVLVEINNKKTRIIFFLNEYREIK